MGVTKRTLAVCASIAATCALNAQAAAPAAGDWLVRAGVSVVDPKSDNGTIHLERVVPAPAAELEVDSAPGFTFNVSYFFTPNIAVELLAAYPFSHDFTLNIPTGNGTAKLDGKVDHLPPTLSVQYHFPINATFKPYVGVGVNWTMFSNEDVDAPVSLSIDDSVGAAAQAGIDIALSGNWLLNFDLRYIQIEGDAKINGVDVGKVTVDPWVYGVHLGYRF